MPTMRFKDFIREHIPIYSVSVVLAIASVLFGLLPYYAVYRLLLRIVQGCDGQTVLWYALIILLSLALETGAAEDYCITLLDTTCCYLSRTF